MKRFVIKKLSVFATFCAMIFMFHYSIAQVKKENNMSEHVTNADSLKGITIHQEIYFSVAPKLLYEVLLSSKQFSECTKKSFNMFTATSAQIDPVPGGVFAVFDGHIIGRVLELIPDQRIVEAWRVVDWPAGVYSIARFEFKTQSSGTQLIFDHIGFPDGLKEHLTIGWQQHYWDALAKYFSVNN